MKNKDRLLSIFKATTGKTTHTEKPVDLSGIAGYQVPRTDRIDHFGIED